MPSRSRRREVDGTEALRQSRSHADGHRAAVADGPDGQEGDSPTSRESRARTITVQYEYPDGPFGHVSFVIGFVDGRVESMKLGRVRGADVTVEVPFLVMALVRQR